MLKLDGMCSCDHIKHDGDSDIEEAATGKFGGECVFVFSTSPMVNSQLRSTITLRCHSGSGAVPAVLAFRNFTGNDEF